MKKDKQLRYLKFGRTDSLPFSARQGGYGGRVKHFSPEEIRALQTQMPIRVKNKLK